MKRKATLVALISGLVYFISTYPLREVLSLFTITDVRPGCVVLLFSSVCFGPAAAFGCAIANGICDYLVGNSLFVVMQALPFQFIYGFVSFKIWKMVTKGDDHSYRIDSINKYLKIALVSFVFALMSSVGVGLLCYMNFSLNPFDIGKFVFLNNFSFSMLFGYPIMIIANIIVSGRGKEKLRRPNISESIIILSSFIEFAGIDVISFFLYRNSLNLMDVTSNYGVWNEIYLNSILFVNCVAVLTIIVLFFVRDKDTK